VKAEEDSKKAREDKAVEKVKKEFKDREAIDREP